MQAMSSSATPANGRGSRTTGNQAAIDLKFPEGPRWHDGAVWFSDQLGGRVLSLAGTAIETEHVLDRPSGLGFLPDGTVRVAVMEPPQIVDFPSGAAGPRHTDLSGFGSHLNDLVVDRLGRTYVDVYQDYGATANGSLVLIDPDGNLRLAAEQLAFPNGIAVTPDGGTLIVSETYAGCLTAFDIASDGSLGKRRVWADLPGAHPDGLCLDAEGAVWVASFLESEFLRVTEGGTIGRRMDAGGRWCSRAVWAARMGAPCSAARPRRHSGTIWTDGPSALSTLTASPSRA